MGAKYYEFKSILKKFFFKFYFQQLNVRFFTAIYEGLI